MKMTHFPKLIKTKGFSRASRETCGWAQISQQHTDEITYSKPLAYQEESEKPSLPLHFSDIVLEWPGSVDVTLEVSWKPTIHMNDSARRILGTASLCLQHQPQVSPNGAMQLSIWVILWMTKCSWVPQAPPLWLWSSILGSCALNPLALLARHSSPHTLLVNSRTAYIIVY